MISSMPPSLHINIDHVATVRQARRTVEPSPLEALKILVELKRELQGYTQARFNDADCAQEGSNSVQARSQLKAESLAGITIHLREDRRHINDRDVLEIDSFLRDHLEMGLTFEMGATEEIRAVCLTTKAKLATIVPESRAELTTEGGMDIIARKKYLKEFIKPIQANGTQVSFFVDPVIEQISAAHELGAEFVELHTGTYANLFIVETPQLVSERAALNLHGKVPQLGPEDLAQSVYLEYERLAVACKHAQKLGLKTNLGHGLTLTNLPPLLRIPNIQELHIGHSIIANAIYSGLAAEVRNYLELINVCDR